MAVLLVPLNEMEISVTLTRLVEDGAGVGFAVVDGRAVGNRRRCRAKPKVCHDIASLSLASRCP